MGRSTCSARTAAGVARTAVGSVRTRPTSRAVAANRAAGTWALAWSVSVTARAPPDRAMPRRASRSASLRRPAARRLATVPSGQPSCRAASLRVSPSRSHRTIGGPVAGRAGGSTSSSSTGCRSVPVVVRRRPVRASPAPAPPAGPASRRSSAPSPPSGGRRRTASCRPPPAARSTPPCGRGRGTWPGRRPRRRGGREEAAADAPDHRAVPVHEGLDRGRVLADEGREQVGVGPVVAREGGAAEVVHRVRRHGESPTGCRSTR